jgi:hypothetical protein
LGEIEIKYIVNNLNIQKKYILNPPQFVSAILKK